MMMCWVLTRKFQPNRSENSLPRWMLYGLGLLAILFVAGCAQHKAYQQPSAWQKEGGLVASGKYRGLAFADLDNDGNMDLVGGSAFPGTVAIWYGNGSGEMSAPQYLPFKGDVRSVAVADFDEDGLKDIVLSVQKESSGIMVWKNQPDRRWERGKSPIEINDYEGLRTADVNADGHMDIIAANATSDTQGGIQVWLGDGKGAWFSESGPTVTGIFMDVAVADFDQDGHLDLAGAGWGNSGALKVWLGDGVGGWSSTAPLSKGSFYGLSIADVNADGHLDILAGSYRKGIQIFQGDGQGKFRTSLSPQENDSFWQVLAVDLDGDARMDLVAGSLTSKGIKAWRNAGQQAWLPVKGHFPSTGTFYTMALADLDNDGLDDMGAASFGEGIKIWLGKEKHFVSSRDLKTKEMSSTGTSTAFEETKENSVFTTISGVPQYRIGPRDVLEITLWKGTEATRELITVQPAGSISFGIIEDLNVKGLTASQVDDILTEQLKKYIKNPRVDVLVKEYKSKYVTILGPGVGYGGRAGGGKQYLTGKTTIVEVLSEAVDLSKDANLGQVGLRRKNGQSLKLNLFSAILKGEAGQNVVLDDRDAIYIPIITKEANRVYVFGEVAKPGVYSFSGPEMRLLDVISQAGGVTIFAHENDTKIVRGDPTRPEVISTNIKKLIEEGDQTQNLALANGDVVYVPRSAIGDVNLFAKRIRPLLEVILLPSSTITEFNDAYDVLKK